ncbi:MAG: hypothetical protein OQJ84_06305 [Xanthomonadales bacterium]|nr:hypothetical protein [Xanthomonadales bacterium]
MDDDYYSDEIIEDQAPYDIGYNARRKNLPFEEEADDEWQRGWIDADEDIPEIEQAATLKP